MSTGKDTSATSQSAVVGERFKGGDRRAVEEVRLRVRRTLAFRGYGIPSEDRQDLEQIVMTQIWQSVERPGFDPAAGFWAFVDLVVARRCIDWRRSHREEVGLEESAELSAPQVSPLGAALARERRNLARAVVERLPAACKEIIRLHLAEGLSYAKAARRLGVGEGALRVRMHRCIKRAQKIRRHLEATEKSLPTCNESCRTSINKSGSKNAR